MIRDSATNQAVVVGVASIDGPECPSSMPQDDYGIFVDVRQYLDVIASWRAGEQIGWDSMQAGSSSNGGLHAGSSSSSDVITIPEDTLPSVLPAQPLG